MKEDLYATKRWRRVQSLTEQFWSHWKKEHLLNILTRQKWHVRQHIIKVNDIVIKDYNLPRNQWHLARVSETFQKSHGLIHRVKIQSWRAETLPKTIFSFQTLRLLKGQFKNWCS